MTKEEKLDRIKFYVLERIESDLSDGCTIYQHQEIVIFSSNSGEFWSDTFDSILEFNSPRYDKLVSDGKIILK